MDGWVPPGREHGVVGPVRVDPTGERGPTRRQAAGPDWRRTSHGLYVPSHVDVTAEQRVVEAGYLVPGFSAITGWGSLRWQGGGWFTGDDAAGELLDVPIMVGRHRIRSQAGVLLCGERFDPREATNLDGIWVASSVQSTCFAMRYAPSVGEAAVVLEMAAFDDLVSVAEMWEYADRRASYTGIPQCRDAIPHADENCWSPMEGRMMRSWIDTGLGVPLTNRPLFDLGGRHLGTPDLIDPRAGVIGQYDGTLHLVGAQRRRDLRRDETFLDHGLETVVAMSGDLTKPSFTARLRAAYARARARPASDRTWTLELPPWWVPTFTVEQRRALDDQQRATWLGHRRAA